jgi:hypothetical protein
MNEKQFNYPGDENPRHNNRMNFYVLLQPNDGNIAYELMHSVFS